MEPAVPSEGAHPFAAFAKEGEDPELAAIKRLLKLLDKAAKSARTFGVGNPVAQRFFQQFYDDLTAHLAQYHGLAFLIQRNQLLVKDQVVYQPDRDATGDSFAFKMYADGIRELTFHEGLAQEDLAFFLDALWGAVPEQAATDESDAGMLADQSLHDEEDDDIVTRLWARNLDTITLVTAEELVRSSGFGMEELELQTHGYMDMSESSLRDLLDRERAAMAAEKQSRTTTDAAETAEGAGGARSPRVPTAGLGYEVAPEELAALAGEITAESSRNAALYVIEILTAVLASESSPLLVTKLLDLWDGVLDTLIRTGQWTAIETVLTMLQDVEGARPDLTAGHKQQLSALMVGLARPERLKAVGVYLNRSPDLAVEGLATFLSLMNKDAVPGLCSLLAALTTPAHQAVVMETLQTLAKDYSDPVIRGLTDKRIGYVRNLLTLIGRWNDPRLADPVEKALRHADAAVRRDALRLLALLRPSGNGTKLVALLQDADETVRLTAMKILTTGQYTAAFSLWSPHVMADSFHDRSPAERRAVYLAMKHTAADEAVPYWQSLLTEWSWTNRKKKEELALLAAETLGKLGTPAAMAALELGQKKGAAAVRTACATALAAATHRQRTATPTAANS